MANRYYTVMVVPEKTSHVRKFIVPTWVARSVVVVVAFIGVTASIMLIDYGFVMNQISENRDLKLENRRLRQQVQVFKNKMTTVESTMERVKTFATRLKVITNTEDRGGLLQSLNEKLPDSNTNTGAAPQGDVVQLSPALSPQISPAISTSQSPVPPQASVASAGVPVAAASSDDLALQRDFTVLDDRFVLVNKESLYVEQMLHDQYELLADQKAFLAALPTRKPAVGYFTSGFGIRKSPYGGRVKMHEGLDIANRPGTQIKAPADGVVVFSDSKAGYGQTLIIDHGYGLETWYGHTRKLLAKKGQKVHRGDTVALLGNSGRSTGPHVHYEVRVHGTPVDPLSYILEN